MAYSSPSTRSFAGSEHNSSSAGGGAAFSCLPQNRLRLHQRRKSSRKRPPKLRSSRPKYNERLETALMGTSRWVISTLRSKKRPWGQKKNFHIYFFRTRGKMRLIGEVYRSFGTGNRWRPIVDRLPAGASFSSIMRFKLCPGSQDPSRSRTISAAASRQARCASRRLMKLSKRLMERST